MELEEAIERLKRGIEDTMFSTLYSQEQEEEDIKTVLNYLTKQDKMIELMIEELAFGVFDFKSKKQAKQYFEKKAEENK